MDQKILTKFVNNTVKTLRIKLEPNFGDLQKPSPKYDDKKSPDQNIIDKIILEFP